MIEYKSMTEKHIPGMVETEKECFDSGFAENTFQRELENKIAHYVVALDGEKAVGYAGLWNICGEADIMSVAVRRAYRHCGIAEKMLSELTKWCKENDVYVMQLEVREGNVPALCLYEKMGFEVDGVRPGYYGGTEDAILMSKMV